VPEQSFPPSTSAEPTPAIGPVRPKERIDTIDILRGWAIFGILLVNMWSWQSRFAPEELWPGPADQAVVWLMEFFALGKFWSLFSFLFGLGFALQLGRAEARGARFVPLYRRRLFVLLLFGLVHQLIIVGFGDFLHGYAVLGFLLLLFRALPPRKVLVVAFLFGFMLHPAYEAVDAGIRELRRADQQTVQQATPEPAQQEVEGRAQREELVRVYTQGTIGEIAAYNAQQFVRKYSSVYGYLGWLWGPFFVFLLGLYVGRRRLFENIPAHLPFIRKVFWWGLGLGLVGTSVGLVVRQLPNPVWPFFAHQVGAMFYWGLGGKGLCFFYASAIILLAQRAAWKKRLAPLAAVGRMALSNYLFQTLVGTTIFYGYGLGLYGKIGPAIGVGLTVLIYASQILLSVWWLRRFRFGPAEWLWRSLTYGKLQPIRVVAREA
jgi:uncharacterized protein